MKILTKENASEMLGGKPLDSFLDELSTRLRLVRDTYSIPPSAFAMADLSNLFAYLLLRGTNVCIYISDWGMWGEENLDLLYAYRRSFGDNRFLIEAPVHLFEQREKAAFVSILAVSFYSVWDAWVFDLDWHGWSRC